MRDVLIDDGQYAVSGIMGTVFTLSKKRIFLIEIMKFPLRLSNRGQRDGGFVSDYHIYTGNNMDFLGLSKTTTIKLEIACSDMAAENFEASEEPREIRRCVFDGAQCIFLY